MISTRYAWKHLSGSGWTYLPKPARGIGKPKIRYGGDRTAVGGQQSQDTAIQLHTFTLPFTYLTDTEYAILKTIRDTLGPHYYTDDNGTTTYNVLYKSLDATVNIQGYTEAVLILQQYQ